MSISKPCTMDELSAIGTSLQNTCASSILIEMNSRIIAEGLSQEYYKLTTEAYTFIAAE